MTYPIDFFFCRASDVPIEKFAYIDMPWMQTTLGGIQDELPYRQLDAATKKTAYDAAKVLYDSGQMTAAEMQPIWDAYEKATQLVAGLQQQVTTFQKAIATYPQRSALTWSWDIVAQRFQELPAKFNDFLRGYGFEFDWTFHHEDLGITQRDLYTAPVGEGSWIEGDPSCGVCLQNAEPAGQGLHNNKLFPLLYSRYATGPRGHWRDDNGLEVGRLVVSTIDGGGHDAGFPPTQPGNDCGKASQGDWWLRYSVTGIKDHCGVKYWAFPDTPLDFGSDTFHEMLHAMDVWCHPGDRIPEDDGYALSIYNTFPTEAGGFLSKGQLFQLERDNQRFLRKVAVPVPPVEPPPTIPPVDPLTVTPTSMQLGLVTNRKGTITSNKPAAFSLIGRAATIQMQDSLTATVFAQRKGGATVGVKSGDEIIYVQVNVKRW